jgi:hypothetical protein
MIMIDFVSSRRYGDRADIAEALVPPHFDYLCLLYNQLEQSRRRNRTFDVKTCMRLIVERLEDVQRLANMLPTSTPHSGGASLNNEPSPTPATTRYSKTR